ncbi:MAG TPA: outer membrane protein transport protein [Bryobacteraceae bacterium]|nr:outer membrane protein transport protein [Bryobacteraceae bacterium]
MRFRTGLIVLIGGLVGAQWAYGSAFAINELGVRAMGMAGAFTATADDGSAIFYNPAGIAFQPGTQLQSDLLAVVGLFRFFPGNAPVGQVVPANGFSGLVKPHFIPIGGMYATHSLNDKITLGFGIFVPFGLASNFENFNDGDPSYTKYPGRFAGDRAGLQEYWFQPTIAYRVTPNSSFAVGVAYVHTHIFLQESILNPLTDGKDFGKAFASTIFPGVDQAQAAASIARLLPEGRFRAAATANSPALNLGYLYKNQRTKTNFGISWRSAVANHLHGQAAFSFLGGTLPQFLPSGTTMNTLFPNQAIAGTFTTPATYSFGVANSKFWNTLIEADLEIQDFHRFKDFPINFSDVSKDTATPAEQRLVFNFNNSYILKLGIEKQLNKLTTVRAGYSFDHTPVPDQSVSALFPDSSRNSFTIGASRERGNLEFSAYYQAMFFLDRVTNESSNINQYTNGDYNNFAHLLGIGLRLFPGGRVATK